MSCTQKTNASVERRHASVLLATIFAALFSGCATILNKPSQPVTINTADERAVLYLNGQEAGRGSTVALELPRELKAQQLRVSRPGYLDLHAAHAQHKMSPWFIMSIVPFGVLIVPPMLDSGPKAYDYDKTRSLTPTTERVERQPNQQRMALQAFQLDLGDSGSDLMSLRYKEWESEDRDLLGEPMETGRPFSPDADYLSDALGYLLAENGFALNPESIRPGSGDLVFLDASLKNASITVVSANMSELRARPEFCVASVEVAWQLSSTIGDVLLSRSTWSTSGEFSVNQYGQEQAMQKSLADAVSRALNEFLALEQTQEAIRKAKPFESEDPTLAIPAPNHPPQDLGEATDAMATLFYVGGHGSGFLISEEGHMLTRNSFLEMQDSVHVRMADREIRTINPLLRNREFDLALIQLQGEYPHAFRLSVPGIKVGSTVFALGTPEDAELGPTLEKGIVSGIRKVNGHDWLVTDLEGLPTYNGGVLLDEEGRLIGLITDQVPGLDTKSRIFGIPVQAFMKSLEFLQK